MVFFTFSVDMSLRLMSFAFQLKNFISISLVQVSWQTILCYFIYWKCPYSTLKFEGYFCWMWNSKLAVVLFVLFVVCLFCLLFCLLFVCFVCFPTFCSLDHSCPFHSWSSLFAICPVLSLGNSLTGSSLHRLILVSPVSFHATQRSLLTILSKTRLLCDSLIFLFTSSVIFLQRLYLFPCFLSFYVNSSVWKFTLYSLIFLAFGEISGIIIKAQGCFPNVEWMHLKLRGTQSLLC